MPSTAEFLVESLLADALLLDEWGTHAEGQPSQAPAPPQTPPAPPNSATEDSSCSEASHPPTPPSAIKSPLTASKTKPSKNKEADASAAASLVDGDAQSQAILELRRRRNRESMQRARQKQREDIESMHRTLEALSLQFEKLREHKQSSNSDASSTPSELLLRQSAPFAQLEADYGTLAETSHRLKAEKFLLQRMIVEHEKTKLRLLEAIKSSSNAPTATNEQQLAAIATPHQEPPAQFFEYSDITPEQAQDAVSACYRRIVHYEQTAQPLAHWIVDANGPCRTFGWTVTCEISTGNNFFLSMTKRLPGVSAQEAMERSWSVMSRARKEDRSPSRRLARSSVLQILNDSTCVVANDLHHPIKKGVRMRSISVRCRMATKRGYAVCLGTVNPQNPALRKQNPAVDYMDVSTWHDFAYDDDDTGCVVSLKSLTEYNTDENLHLRLINALCTTWRWESDVMQRPMRFLAL